MTLITFLCIVLFLIGLYFYAKYGGDKELMTNMKPRCPDMLIQNGSKFFLYNSKLAKVPGVNPIEFNNLEEYTEFLDWQRSQNILIFRKLTVVLQRNLTDKFINNE